MRLFDRILILSLIISLPSCIDSKRSEVKAFYNIDSLVTAQILELVRNQPMLSKTGSVNDDSGDTRFQPDSITWERELGMFRALDINEPRLVEIYQMTESDIAGGIRISYNSKNPKNTRVNWIEIEQHDDKVISLRAEVSESNPIYGNLREIGMKFTNDGLLAEYYIVGGEKLSVKDTLAYRMNATIMRD